MAFDPNAPRRSEHEPWQDVPEPPRRRGLQIFGFPLRIDPFFFVTAWLIGGRQEPQWMLIWVALVFTGVLAHELGHAFAGRKLGMEPWIQLMAFGGMTGWQRPRQLTSGQQIMISAAGPAVGIVIGGTILVAGIGGVLGGMPPDLLRVLDMAVWVNLGWGLLNLLPILPMDGGHIASAVAEMAAGRNGRLAARGMSVILCVVIGLWALLAGQWWILILCVVFTLANAQALRSEFSNRRFSDFE